MPLDRLLRIAGERDVRVVYAAERGSRCFGTDGPSSDHDLFCVVASPPARYWSLVDAPGAYGTVHEADVSVAIVDIRRAMHLALRGSIEIHDVSRSLSVVTDPDGLGEDLRSLSARAFRAGSAVLQLGSVLERAMAAHRRQQVTSSKVWLHVLRPMLALMHVARTGAPAPVRFAELVRDCPDRDLAEVAATAMAAKRFGDGRPLEPSAASVVLSAVRVAEATVAGVKEPKRPLDPDLVAEADAHVTRIVMRKAPCGPS